MRSILFATHTLPKALAIVALILGSSIVRADEPKKPEPTVYDAAARAVAKGWTEKSRMVGFSIIKTQFTEVPRDGAILVGFDLGLGKFLNIENIYAIRPVYRTAGGEVCYGEHGLFRNKNGSSKHEIKTKVTRTVSIRARHGYAVGAITLRTGLNINGLSVTFNAIKGKGLDPYQSYQSEWVGDRTGGGESSLKSEGAPIVGVFGNEDVEHVMALGIVTMRSLSLPAPAQSQGAARKAADAAPQPDPNVPTGRILDKYYDHEHHFSLTIPDSWTRMSRTELEAIRNFVRLRGMEDLLQYETGFRPNNSPMGTFPYILVQIVPFSTAGLTYQEIQDKLGQGIDEPLKIVEERVPDLARGLKIGQPTLDKSHNRIVVRLSSEVAGVGQAEAISMCHLSKDGVVGIHCYAKADSFEKRLPLFMDINNSFFFDDGYEFVAAKSSPKGNSNAMLYAVLAVLVIGAGGAFAAIIGRGRMRSTPRPTPMDMSDIPMVIPIAQPSTGIQEMPLPSIRPKV